MLFNCNFNINLREASFDKNKAIFLVKKMLPEYVFDTSQLENNPITFPEVQTLLDGISIGGRKIVDVDQVLNIKKAWITLLEDIKSNEFQVSKSMFCKINGIIAREEALEWGKFRSGQVSISGTKIYQAPNFKNLDSIFSCELNQILDGFNPVEQAIRLFLWGALNQFFWDGNKRTARIISNGILINSGIGVFNIKSEDILEFNTLMLEFYETKLADNIVKFLHLKCVKYF